MHGPQCICEICTCGRHQCPFDRAKGASSNGIFAANGSGAGGEDQFYRKKFATVADGGERAQAARPKGELSLDNMRQPQQQTQTPLTSQQKQQQSAAAAALAVDARNERFVTSAALRKRGQNSQIQLGGGGADEGKQSAMRSTYREESERALQQNGGGGGADRVRVIGRPADSSSQLFGANHPQTPKTTVHRAEFGAKRSERAQPNRPRTSDLWKREGAVEKTSHSREQFAGVQPSNRAEPFRPRENGPLVGAEGGDRTFQRETSNLSDFGPKQGERAEQQRPAGSNLFRSGEPLLERATVNRSEYGQAGRGDRFEPRVQGSSDIWKNEGRMEGRGVNREEYGREGRAERFPATRPRESDILKGQGAFSSETQQRAEFGPKKGERAEVKRPVGSDIWKREGQTEQSSVSRSEFAERGPGDRFPARRPGTDELWRREGRMAEGGSVSRIEYQIEGKRGDRHEIQRPKAEPLFEPDIEPSGPLSTVHRTEFVHRPAPRTERGPAPSSEAMDLLRGDGSFHGETHKSAEFQPKQGDRFEARVQGSSDIWKSEGQMQGQSVSREHFGHTTGGERAEQKRPQESGILKGEGTFSSETQKRVDFGPKKGERAEAKRPVDSTLFRREGPMGLEGSVSRSDYSHTQGERTERHTRRESSGIHRPPEGTEFAKSTVSMEDFGEKHLESPEDWLAHQKRGTGNLSSFGLLDEKDGAAWAQQYAHTMNQEEFAPKELDERTLPVVHRSELSLTDPGAHFHTSTMYSDEFQQISPNSYASRSHARPSTALKLQGPREFTSDYASEFTNKIRPCPAGELVESAKKDHVDTDNFEFHAISKGHHLYKSKENLASEG